MNPRLLLSALTLTFTLTLYSTEAPIPALERRGPATQHNLDEAAAAGQSGSGLQYGPEGPTLQRVALYRYK